MRLAVFAFSRQGCRLACKIRELFCDPQDECRLYSIEKFAQPDFLPIRGALPTFTGSLFHWAEALVFVGSAGIAVRAIAPHVRDKKTDPAVLVVDELGKFVIPLLSGHIGGANAMSNTLAQALGACSVVTTATDIHGKFSVDTWASRNDLYIDDMQAAKAVSAAILEGPVALCSDFPIHGPLPNGLIRGEEASLGICISCFAKQVFAQNLLLVPRLLRLGIGCRRGSSPENIKEAVGKVLAAHNIHPQAVKMLASIDLKQDEAGLLAFAEEMGWPLTFYSAQALGEVEGDFSASSFVHQITGVDNVCERAALLGAEKLIVKKTAENGVTVAVAMEDWEVRFD